MKTAIALLPFLGAATAFVTPMSKTSMARGRSLQMSFDDEAGAIQWFPPSPGYWDPLGFVADGDTEKFSKYRAIEIKHGRVAMLGALDYFIKTPSGWHLPGKLGDVDIDSIPVGLGAIKAVPPLGWVQILLFASALEFLAPQKEDQPPGAVQPATPSFEQPGTLEYQTKEINNGRLAMIALAGLWLGELASGGTDPIVAFKTWVGI